MSMVFLNFFEAVKQRSDLWLHIIDTRAGELDDGKKEARQQWFLDN
jgi:hypothetical protein